MKNMLKMLVPGIIFLAAAGTMFAQVDREELEKNLAPVTFTNNEGPYAVIESREQIRRIGAVLGQAIKAGNARAGTPGRYYVIHCVSAPDGGKLDADIFILGSGAGVDHIRNLRTIVQGYLQEAYGYSEKDAALLAEYTTIYNAVYRLNMDYFSGRYKKPVLDNLNPGQAGLSLRYSEWPGNTMMLIPLGRGGLSSVDTSAISDSRVIEEMRKDDDRGVEQRKDMVDLKEREAEEAEQNAAGIRETIQSGEKSIAEERGKTEQEQKQIAEDRRQLEEEKAAGTVTKEDAAKKEEELAKRETEAENKSGELDRREEELAVQRDEAERQEQFAEQKNDEARRDRENIARDQQDIIDQGELPRNLIGAVIERKDTAMGRLIGIDPNTRQEQRRSPLDTVYVRTLTFISGKILAIAGENRGNGAVRLIEINSRSLEMVKQGDDDLHPGSLIWVNGSDLYAITARPGDGAFYLGRFNTDLVLQAKSAVKINPNAAVYIQQGSLLTQREDGGILILEPADLTEK